MKYRGSLTSLTFLFLTSFLIGKTFLLPPLKAQNSKPTEIASIASFQTIIIEIDFKNTSGISLWINPDRTIQYHGWEMIKKSDTTKISNIEIKSTLTPTEFTTFIQTFEKMRIDTLPKVKMDSESKTPTLEIQLVLAESNLSNVRYKTYLDQYEDMSDRITPFMDHLTKILLRIKI